MRINDKTRISVQEFLFRLSKNVRVKRAKPAPLQIQQTHLVTHMQTHLGLDTCKRGPWKMSQRLDAVTATSFQWAGGQTGQVPCGKFSHTWTSNTDFPRVVQGHTTHRGRASFPHRFVTAGLPPVLWREQVSAWHLMKKSRHEASCVVSLLPCVGRTNARDPHTQDTVEEATGTVVAPPTSLPLSCETADTTEHTVLHPQAPCS